MDRRWLLTWTTYGTWLPGDPRGSVTRVREGTDRVGPRLEWNVHETPYLGAAPGLVSSSSFRLRGETIRLGVERASTVARQLEESSRHRGWELLAGSVMANHVHVVVGVLGDPEPSKLLQIPKSYASRSLNERRTRPASGTWRTASGSMRKLANDDAVAAATAYVRQQAYVLARCEIVPPPQS